MPFYYRDRSGRSPVRSRWTIRLATLTTLAAYPAGCIVQLVLPDTTPQAGLTLGEITGFALIVLAFIGFAITAPSWFQRIVGEQSERLDEFEMAMRHKAYAFSYLTFSGLALIGAIFMALAAGQDGSAPITLWVPSTYDHWNAIFWGMFVYAAVLPTAYLAWAGPAPLDDADRDAALTLED